MNVLTYWLDAHKRIPMASAPGDAEHLLLKAATHIAGYLEEARVDGEASRYRHEHWSAVGVDAVEGRISSDGAAFSREGRLRVVVKAKQPRFRQRYTVAHEIGHVLLRQLMAENEDLRLPTKMEESLCDEFAARVLVPDGALQMRMAAARSAPGTQDLLKWCKDLEVNIKPMLIAAKNHWRWAGAATVYCENYAHRESEEALRIVGYVANEKLFLPIHKRMSSVGLVGVNIWFAESDEPYGTGTQTEVRLPLYARDMHTRTGHVEGCVEWSAMRMKESAGQRPGRVLIDLKLVGDWSVRWAGGKAETFSPTKMTNGL